MVARFIFALRISFSFSASLREAEKAGMRWWVADDGAYLFFHCGSLFCMNASMPSLTSSAIMLQAITSAAYS